jgi:alcohol dehydrogenase, propanol-preferring
MHALVLDAPAPVATRPLVARELPEPTPGPDEVVVRVAACGVCRTDLHVVEGDLPWLGRPLVPGHQAVGRIERVGAAVAGLRPGERVGVAWVNRCCGQCEHCVAGRENLCLAPVFTGYHRDGGYAERVVVPAAFAHPMPGVLGDDAAVAPLLCAGIIGFRALRRSAVQPGERLGLWGFGSSAHIALQVARAWGCTVFVVTRDADARARALDLGATWVGEPGEAPPQALDGAISFAPAGAVIPEALAALRRGGTLAIAGIYVDRVPELDYERHLFQEKRLVSVTANTRADARALLTLAARVPLRTDIATYDLAEANDVLIALKHNALPAQAAVLVVARESA